MNLLLSHCLYNAKYGMSYFQMCQIVDFDWRPCYFHCLWKNEPEKGGGLDEAGPIRSPVAFRPPPTRG